MVDIDYTVDLAHGGQQLSLFSSRRAAGTQASDTCFQRILTFEAGTGKPAAAILRPGKRPSGGEAAMVIGHITDASAAISRAYRSCCGETGIRHIRGHGHAGGLGCTYVLGLLTNIRLKAIVAPCFENAANRRAIHDTDGVRGSFRRTMPPEAGAASDAVTASLPYKL